MPDDENEAPYIDVKAFDKGSLMGKSLLATGSFWLGNSAYYRELRNKRNLTLSRSSRTRGQSEPERDIWSNEDLDEDEQGHQEVRSDEERNGVLKAIG